MIIGGHPNYLGQGLEGVHTVVDGSLDIVHIVVGGSANHDRGNSGNLLSRFNLNTNSSFISLLDDETRCLVETESYYIILSIRRSSVSADIKLTKQSLRDNM